MMLCRYSVFFFFVVGTVCTGSAQSMSQNKRNAPSPVVMQFFQKAYAQNFAPRIVFPSLLSLKLADFVYAVSYFNTVFVTQPWVILGVAQRDYTGSAEQRATLLFYSDVYHQFFKQLFMKQDGGLVLYAVPQNALPGHYNLFDFLKQLKYLLFTDFYARYFDLLSADYIEKINGAYKMCGTSEYAAVKKEIFNLLNKMTIIFSQYLKNTSYENRYARHVKSYAQVYNLLQLEHKKMVDA